MSTTKTIKPAVSAQVAETYEQEHIAPNPASTAELKAMKDTAEQFKKQLHSLLKEQAHPNTAMSQLAKQTIIDLIESTMDIFEDYGNTFSPIERMP